MTVPTPAADPRITKRRVTMNSVTATPTGQANMSAVDYVPQEILDAYVADAKLRWQSVEVSEEYDAGPGGYDGATYIPENLAVPNAGTLIPATEAS